MEDLKPIIIVVQYVDNQTIAPAPEPPSPFNPFKDTKMLLGFGAIAVSLMLFATSYFSSTFLSNGLFLAIHMAVFMLFISYTFGQKAATSTFPTRLNYTFLWLVLLQIGCFTFNIELTIFPPSTVWLQVVLVLSSAALIGLTFRDLLPEKIIAGLLFLIGVGFVMDIYFMVILLPTTFFCTMGLVLLGLTVYAFGPLLKIIFITHFLIKNHVFASKLTRFFAFGVAFSTVMSLVFILLWTSMARKAGAAFDDTNSSLPAWVRVAQVLPPSVLTEKMLKSNQSGRFQDGGFLAFDTNNDRFHDPLVSIGNALKPLPDLSQLERANALRAIFDAKNAAERRLWTGDNLRLASVETAIEWHTPQRLAYTEQILRIENTEIHKNAWRTEEAILTFRMPEGGVVSSLSLWVNGVEREGLLTTQEKAAEAYQKIVGVERRDPSVVHWQEGNAVSVRVFPCTPLEIRQVKIGFTTPLEVSSGRLFYHLPTLEGLPMNKARHTVSLTGVEAFESRSKFQKNDKKYTLSETYDSDLALSTAYAPLSESVFSFQNKTYHIHEIMDAEGKTVAPYQHFEPSEIYLDINAAWSNDAEQIWQLVKNKPVFACIDGKMTAVTEANRANIFKQLAKQNFSIFPFHQVENPDNALVISMNDRPFAPNFTDLKGSRFADEMAEKLPNMPQIRTFTLGSTTYLDAMKQMRITLSDKGTVDKLTKILTEKIFIKNIESTNELAILPSNILIKEEKDGTKKISGDAPDHVLRLFAYNKILAAVGRTFYKKTGDAKGEQQTDLIAQNSDFTLKDALKLAEKANIVTPISSLIVLETQADYDRFKIRKSKNALGNASLIHAGAAPEPHEWVLIIVALGVVLWTIRNRTTECYSVV